MHRALALAALSALLLGGAAGCPGSLAHPERFTGDGGGLPTSCALNIDVETDLLAQRCTGSVCHSATAPANGLDLETPGAGDRMVNTPATGCTGHFLIDSTAPAQSLILAKLSGTEPDSCGAPMPLGQDPISPDEYDCVAAWVAQKAGQGGGGSGGADAGADVDAALAVSPAAAPTGAAAPAAAAPTAAAAPGAAASPQRSPL